MQTDARSVTMQGILSQKKEEGKIHSIQSIIRTMNVVERKYSICEQDYLAVTFALMKFRVDLLSTQPFRQITYHQAERDALKKRDIHRRLMKWLNFLAEYEFEVSYAL